MLTWGDGVSDVDLDELLKFHTRARQARDGDRGAAAGALRPHRVFDGDRVVEFTEKPQTGEGWINGAFFVLEPRGLRLHRRRRHAVGSASRWSGSPRDGQLMAYRHDGFWQCMDTMRDKQLLEKLWESGQAPWKVWELERCSVARHRPRRLHRARPRARCSRARATRSRPRQRPVQRLHASGRREPRRPGDPQATSATSSRHDLRGFDAVVHLAGISNDPLGDLDPADCTYDINHRGLGAPRRGSAKAGRRRPLRLLVVLQPLRRRRRRLPRRDAPLQPGHAVRRVARCWPSATSPPLADDDFSPTFLRSATAYGVSPRLRGDLVRQQPHRLRLHHRRGAHQERRHAVAAARAHRGHLAARSSPSLEAPRELVHNEAFNVGSTAENYRDPRGRRDRRAEVVPGSKVTFADGAGPDARNYRVNCDKLAARLPRVHRPLDGAAGHRGAVGAYLRERGLTARRPRPAPGSSGSARPGAARTPGSSTPTLRWTRRGGGAVTEPTSPAARAARRKLRPFLDLGRTPLADALVRPEHARPRRRARSRSRSRSAPTARWCRSSRRSTPRSCSSTTTSTSRRSPTTCSRNPGQKICSHASPEHERYQMAKCRLYLKA